MRNTIDSAPKDGQFIIVVDSSGQHAVARWSSKFEAWFGLDGEPVVIHPIYWRTSPIKDVPKLLPTDGELVIVEDSSGQHALARWSIESETWLGPDGEPIVIRPTSWRPRPTDSTPNHPEGALTESAADDPIQLNSAGTTLEEVGVEGVALVGIAKGPDRDAAVEFAPKSQFVIAEDSSDAFKFEEPRDLGHEHIGGPLASVEGPSRELRRTRRALPLFSVAVISIIASAILMVFRGDGDVREDFRAALAWLRSSDFMSAAGHAPDEGPKSVSSDALQTVRRAEGDAPQEPIVDKEAAERRANLADDKSEPRHVQQVDRNGAHGRQPEDSHVVTPGLTANDVGELRRARESEEVRREVAEVPREPRVDKPVGEQPTNLPDDKPEQSASKPSGAINKGPEDGGPSGRQALATQDVAALSRGATNEASEPGPVRPIDREARQIASLGPDTAETAKLLERASGLLKRGDIGAARLVLDLAHELGSARATFMLAETYDPFVLLAWNAFGMRADPGKARELYARAYAAGIVEAKGRSDALNP